MKNLENNIVLRYNPYRNRSEQFIRCQAELQYVRIVLKRIEWKSCYLSKVGSCYYRILTCEVTHDEKEYEVSVFDTYTNHCIGVMIINRDNIVSVFTQIGWNFPEIIRVMSDDYLCRSDQL